ncbi:amidophosphoribosyltransferase [uncultured Cohaesibacter sp.]|uniref:amidophosphoribosyltransferase n=1 Tax=uncultured Cohaesibacter sp. TaxID=1002546 RepID=UPI0029C99E2B|nr:amidophosphoribosyltransferase [uncultured Cohaesibacter sp.]
MIEEDSRISTETATVSPNTSIDDDWNGEGDTLHEECGVFGIFGTQDAAALAALGLHALQHRGQEAAGIATYDGEHFHLERRFGLVGDNFSNSDVLERLPGKSAIGHNRYSTAGGAALRNVQPLFAELEGGGIAVAHNGQFTNAMTLRKSLIKRGAIFQSTSDSEVVLQLIAKSRESNIVDRFIDGIRQMEGGYALVALTRKKLIGARDPLGIRPLVLGELEGSPVLASETCALDMIGAKFVREIKNGEVIVCTEDGIKSYHPFPDQPARLDIFEYIYFSRPDSVIAGRSVYEVRKALGRELAKELPLDVDVVVPVPDSGVPAALGYAQEIGIPFELGIVRNHYVGRTFIEPTQQIRALGVRLKHSANRSQVEGKRIVLVDDSLVRGTTSSKIVQMMRDAGAKEVHMLLASPPITHSDYYGIDTPDRKKLLAAQYDLEGMRKYIGADSLGFISIDGVYRSCGYEARNNKKPQFTDHCFTGDYPTALVDLEASEDHRSDGLLKD